MTIEVVLLGTGNPIPDANRAGAATLVRAGSATYLVDTGRAVVMRLAAAGVLPVMIDAVFFTHLHSDHISDFGDVVTTHWVMSQQPTPLKVIGPPGTAAMVAGMKAMFASDVHWRRSHHADLQWEPQLEVLEVAPGTVLETEDVSVVAAATDHRPVEPTLAYRFESGEQSVVVAGDTLPCEGLDLLCAGADLYVQTVLRDDLVNMVPMQRFRDTVDYHSTVSQAAETAARAGVGKLVLTHQIPSPAPGSQAEWIGIAREKFNGEIVFGEDLLKIAP